MGRIPFGVLAVLLLFGPAAAQKSKVAPQAGPTPASASKADAAAETALEKALAESGADRAALVHNLQQYLLQYPDAPRKVAVYRALVEACEQLQDSACTLNYAERFIALQPDNSDMMLLAVAYLQRQGDDASLTRAAGYVTRVLDRVEKTTPDQRSPRESAAEWQARQDNLRGILYYLRGQVENSQHNYDAAVKDLQTSYSIQATAVSAELLGEIAELKGDRARAIQEYTLAFVLPDTGPGQRPDRHEIREKLGNVWRAVHGSEQGLGDEILSAYDHIEPQPSSPAVSLRNKEAKNTFAFVLRRLDGTPMAMSTLRGKAVVLSFWATWCGPCAELEPLLDEVAKAWTGEPNVAFFGVNTDQDQTRVGPFLKTHKWSIPIVYADELDSFLKVGTLPTVIVLDPNGKIVYRVEGFAARGFAVSVSSAIQRALAPSAP